jgi:Cof subfamily protein (haloacid dehalogenase superfamily)
MTHLQDEMGLTHYPLICYNGGYVVSYAADRSIVRVFDSVTIPLDVCRSIVEAGKGMEIHMSLYNQDDWYAPKRDHWTEREERITRVRATIKDPAAVFEHWDRHHLGAHKIMCMGPSDQINEMYGHLQQKHGTEIHVYLSRPTYIELAPKTVSKGSAMKLILEKEFNIHVSDAMAFGDNYNDMDMLQMAGVGIAVDNARDEVKAVADEITLKSTEDGVAVAIEKWLQD